MKLFETAAKPSPTEKQPNFTHFHCRNTNITPQKAGERRFKIRSMTTNDAATIWGLARATGVLDENSAYLYLLLGRDFADTCLVAEEAGELIGFSTGYVLPANSEVLFVWQVGVDPRHHRRGIGLQLLTEMISRKRQVGVRFVEATVSPSNTASLGLFNRLAARHDCMCEPMAERGFAESLFPSGLHESEPALRIGPF
jgi:L-2,4-diaminobutyric acid acetyltransferase